MSASWSSLNRDLFYKNIGRVVNVIQIKGKELSYSDLYDAASYTLHNCPTLRKYYMNDDSISLCNLSLQPVIEIIKNENINTIISKLLYKTSLDPPLWELTYVENTNKLIFSYHHLLVDGVSFIKVLDVLLQYIDGFKTSSNYVIENSVLPKTTHIRQILSGYSYHMFFIVSLYNKICGIPKSPIQLNNDDKCEFTDIKITGIDLTNLLTKTKEKSLTIFGIVSAAFLISLDKHSLFNDYECFLCNIGSSSKSICDPPISSNVTGLYTVSKMRLVYKKYMSDICILSKILSYSMKNKNRMDTLIPSSVQDRCPISISSRGRFNLKYDSFSIEHISTYLNMMKNHHFYLNFQTINDVLSISLSYNKNILDNKDDIDTIMYTFKTLLLNF